MRGSWLGRRRADHVAERVTWVARSARDEPQFDERAARAADELGPRAVPALGRALRHRPFKPPDDLRHEFDPFGGWAEVQIVAIAQILFYLGRPALPVLRREAFGRYEWSQGPAICVLCRLAEKGVDTPRIERQIARALPKWAMETHDRIRPAIASLAVKSPRVMDALQKVLAEWSEEGPDDDVRAYEALLALHR